MRLLVRADGTDVIGMGHLARTLAVATRWLDTGGSASIATIDIPSDWRNRFESIGIEVVAPSDLSEMAGQDAVLLVDGYHLADLTDITEEFRAKVGIDDFGLGKFGHGLDLVIDQSLPPSAELPISYRAAGRVLRGQRYVMLRPDLEAGPSRPSTQNCPRILVSLGGHPSGSVRSWAEDVLSQLDPNIRPLWLLGVENVGDVMSRADIALAAAGSTTWELCRFGVPGLYISLSLNQDHMLGTIAELGCGVALGNINEVSSTRAANEIASLLADRGRIEQVAHASARSVDGAGTRRVVCAMQSLFLSTRPALDSDLGMLFGWANDERTRAMAFRAGPIPWDTHVEWLTSRLGSVDHPTLIVEFDSVPIGQFKADVSGVVASVGITIDRQFRGQRLGAAVVDIGSRAILRANRRIARLEARVLVGNAPSRQAFLAAGYTPAGSGTTDGKDWHSFSYTRAAVIEPGRK
jgi:UDP-2,4-diacetamido-2,4,6-trideoxy-beta-L-altropyranose hydrolase